MAFTHKTRVRVPDEESYFVPSIISIGCHFCVSDTYSDTNSLVMLLWKRMTDEKLFLYVVYINFLIDIETSFCGTKRGCKQKLITYPV